MRARPNSAPSPALSARTHSPVSCSNRRRRLRALRTARVSWPPSETAAEQRLSSTTAACRPTLASRKPARLSWSEFGNAQRGQRRTNAAHPARSIAAVAGESKLRVERFTCAANQYAAAQCAALAALAADVYVPAALVLVTRETSRVRTYCYRTNTKS